MIIKYEGIDKNIFFIFIMCISHQVIAQCVEASFIVPNCITPNTPTDFFNDSDENTNCSVSYQWFVYDNTGWGDFSTDYDFENVIFPSAGTYTIQLIPNLNGSPFGCCPFGQFNVTDFITQITVIDQPIILDVDFETEICSNGSIDYDSLNINIQNEVGNISYDWITIPNGIQWEDFELELIPDSETAVILTVNDNTTGCSDSDTINLNFTQTNADASFTVSSNTLTCQGEFFNFTINNFNDSLYNYNWLIDGVNQNFYDSIFETQLYSNNSTIEISLEVTDLNNGCVVPDYEYISVNSVSNFIEFDTDIASTSSSGFDYNGDFFWYCVPDSFVIDTFINIHSDITGIDSVYITDNNGNTFQFYSDFESFEIQIDNSVSEITVINYIGNSCPPIEFSYEILFNQQTSVFGSLEYCFNNNQCIGDVFAYTIDPNFLNQFSLNAQIFWTESCSEEVDTLDIWDYQDIIDNTIYYDHDCDQNSLTNYQFVFEHAFFEPSCGCVWEDRLVMFMMCLGLLVFTLHTVVINL